MIELEFIGAAATVTGSRHLVRTSRATVLLDCGLFQDHRQESFARNRNTVERGGKFIIPAFALERAQEVIFSLKQLRQARRVPLVPVYVDSPLTVRVTDVFRLHPECVSRRVRSRCIAVRLRRVDVRVRRGWFEGDRRRIGTGDHHRGKWHV